VDVVAPPIKALFKYHRYFAPDVLELAVNVVFDPLQNEVPALEVIVGATGVGFKMASALTVEPQTTVPILELIMHLNFVLLADSGAAERFNVEVR
jgi:hypothetical protein